MFYFAPSVGRCQGTGVASASLFVRMELHMRIRKKIISALRNFVHFSHLGNLVTF